MAIESSFSFSFQTALRPRKAITKPPGKRSRSEGPVARTRKEEAVFREELKKDEALMWLGSHDWRVTIVIDIE